HWRSGGDRRAECVGQPAPLALLLAELAENDEVGSRCNRALHARAGVCQAGRVEVAGRRAWPEVLRDGGEQPGREITQAGAPARAAGAGRGHFDNTRDLVPLLGHARREFSEEGLDLLAGGPLQGGYAARR